MKQHFVDPEGKHHILSKGGGYDLDIKIGRLEVDMTPGAKKGKYIPPTEAEVNEWLGEAVHMKPGQWAYIGKSKQPDREWGFP